MGDAKGEDAGSRAGQLMLAVKPQIFPLVAEEVGEAFAAGPSRVVLSVLAGTTSASIRKALGDPARVVRVMPNTPAQVGRGVSAVAMGAGTRDGDDALAHALMSSVGDVVSIDESMMDAFTGLAGSGPAYVFYLAEALAKAGEAVGFTPEQATTIAEGVVTGSARLLEEDDRDAAALRKAVTSPNGTTQAGTESLDASGVMEAVVKAVTAARDRGRELAES
jgi:pyrroline-5-carboxylate reductase